MNAKPYSGNLAAIKWARAQRFGDARLHTVVRALADRADGDGKTWLGQQRLAEETGYCRWQINKIVRVLDALGVIRRQARTKGREGRITDMIFLSLDRSFNLSRSDARALWQSVVRRVRSAASAGLTTLQKCERRFLSSALPLADLLTSLRNPFLGDQAFNAVARLASKVCTGTQEEPKGYTYQGRDNYQDRLALTCAHGPAHARGRPPQTEHPRRNRDIPANLTNAYARAKWGLA